MSDEVIIEAVNDVYVRVQAEPSIKMELSDHFTFKVNSTIIEHSIQEKDMTLQLSHLKNNINSYGANDTYMRRF